MVQIYNDYKEHADFLTVYVREAHPTDEWQMKSNVKDDVCYAQPKTLAQRVIIANDFIKRFKYPIAFGIDDINNAANDAYAAWPERLYVIDESVRDAAGFAYTLSTNPAASRTAAVWGPSTTIPTKSAPG